MHLMLKLSVSSRATSAITRPQLTPVPESSGGARMLRRGCGAGSALGARASPLRLELWAVKGAGFGSAPGPPSPCLHYSYGPYCS